MRRPPVAHLVASLVLVIAAFAKIGDTGLMFVEVPGMIPLDYRILCVVQLFVSGWLLIMVCPSLSNAFAICLFSLFTLISGYAAYNGVSSCNCFGRIPTHPVLIAMLDISVVALLLAARPLLSRATSNAMPAVDYLARSISAVCILTASLVLADASLGSNLWARCMANLNGRSILLAPGKINIGAGEVGEWRPFDVTVSNIGDSDVEVIGATQTCAVQWNSTFPISLPPRSQKDLRFTGKFVGTPGVFRHQFTLYCDAPQQFFLQGEIVGLCHSSSQ